MSNITDIEPRVALLRDWKRDAHDHGVMLNNLPELPELMMFGGLDLAERVDSSAFFSLQWNGSKLKQHGTAVWPHMKYPIIVDHVGKMDEKFNFDVIGFDETGVGIAVGEMFSQELPMEPLVMTVRTKLDCIRIVQWLIDEGVLVLEKGDAVIREAQDQEKIITDAGTTTYKHPKGRHDDRFWSLAICCYVAVPYIIGVAPASIMSTPDEEIPIDVDRSIKESMMQYSKKYPGL